VESQLEIKRVGRIAAVAALFFPLLCSVPFLSHAARPWKGQVVDKETKKPIDGVVVLMVWYRHYSLMDQTREYHDSEEAVTDANGRFTISSRWYWNWFVFPEKPDIFVFKGGYGRWEIQDYGKYTEAKYPHPLERRAARLADEGAVLEFQPINSREERVEQLRLPILVPRERLPKLREAVNNESEKLGLGKIYP
jgi:hypothetical protein